MFRIELICTDLVKDKLNAIIKGFYSLIPYEIISIFTVEEFEFLLSGQNNVDINDWKKNTIYQGYYNENHPVKYYI
jgi:E3 ubiquitin-protein ligase HUWE1